MVFQAWSEGPALPVPFSASTTGCLLHAVITNTDLPFRLLEAGSPRPGVSLISLVRTSLQSHTDCGLAVFAHITMGLSRLTNCCLWAPTQQITSRRTHPSMLLPGELELCDSVLVRIVESNRTYRTTLFIYRKGIY